MHSNELEANGIECCCFGFITNSNFCRVFDVFLDLGILPYSNPICINLDTVKLSIDIYCVLFLHACNLKMAIIKQM